MEISTLPPSPLVPASLNSGRITVLRRSLSELKKQAEALQRKGDFEAASALLYRDIPELENQLADAERAEERFRQRQQPGTQAADPIAE
ncbi:hypothetical protein ACFTWS_39800 [Streptomyces sp. NPDC057027]|uniref:hypothetical protein n=1 Tax=Streptomyces sp. NPDC057027 TaxID=3346004 RepID=UPI00362B6B1E